MLCEPCDFGPRWNLCRLIVPANPLPIEMPDTLIVSPGSNASTVTVSPTVNSERPRNSTSLRCGSATPFARRCPSSPFDSFHSGGKVEAHQRVHRLGRRAVDVDQPLVRAHLEVLARVLVLERAADHAVDVLLGGQGHRAGDRRAGSLRRLDDVASRLVHLVVVVALEPDADLL